MAVALNEHLRNGTEDINIKTISDIEEGLCDFYNIDGDKYPDFIQFFMDQINNRDRRWDIQSTAFIHYVENVLGYSFYSAPDYNSVGLDDGFNFKTAIEKAREEGNKTVVVENMS